MTMTEDTSERAKAVNLLSNFRGFHLLSKSEAASPIFDEIRATFDLPAGDFLGEDVFGDLFFDDGGSIRKIVLTADEVEPVCEGISDLPKAIKDDIDYLTGEGFLSQWEQSNGPLPEGHRLCQVTPILMGGAFDVDNFKAVPAEETRRYAFLILRTVRENPGGSFRQVVGDDGSIRFDVVSSPARN